MMNFIAPKQRTLKEEIGLVCSLVFNGSEMALVFVRCIDGQTKEYKKADYKNYKEMTKTIMEDFAGCEYKTSKIINFEANVVLTKCEEEVVNENVEEKNKEIGVLNMIKMTKAELREELAKHRVELSNNEFKTTKHQELLERLEAEYKLRDVIQKNKSLIETEIAPVEEIVGEKNNSLMVQGVAIPEDVKQKVLTPEDIGALIAAAITPGIDAVVKDIVVPAVVNAVEDSSAKILAELKSQLDTMNSTISALVTRQGTQVTNYNQVPKEVLGNCEDCGADITTPNVLKYSQANCNGHVYCYTHQQAHKVARQNATGNFGQPQVNNQPQQSASIIKSCMCCGTKTKYASETVLNNSVAKAQALGLKPIICKKCADKILAERKTVPQQPIQPEFTPSVQPIVPQMPIGNSTQTGNPNNQGF